VRREQARTVRAIARVGFAAKGVVYVLVGILAAKAALGAGAPEGSEGALRTIELQPFGQVLLGLTALGLVAYVLWRLVSAVLNPDGESAVKRVAHAGAALVYAGLAFEAGRMALGTGGGSTGGGAGTGASSSGEQRAAHWTGEVLGMPFGPLIIGAIAVGIAAYGVYQLYKAWTADVGDELELTTVSQRARRTIIAIGRAGLAARGIVLMLIGWFLAHAALQADAGEVRGLGGALRALEGEAYGPVLLGVVAVGLVAYGVYQFVRARYRRLRA
jgi:Domain of Unknown Function (DUF1206)